jgi:KipI family sensor histidine kinase inhibitor
VGPRRGPAGRRRVHPLGDTALLVELGVRLDTALNSRAVALAAALAKRRGVRESVPACASVTVHFDPDTVNAAALTREIEQLLRRRPPAATPGRLHRVPALYDGEDMAFVCQRTGLTRDTVVRLHTAPIYRVFMLGFLPGWGYLGPVPEPLRLPRRDTPRASVPAGAVAIAEALTGVYPLPSPGGWHLIGRTSLRVLLPSSDPPSLFRAGDRVKFFDAARA